MNDRQIKMVNLLWDGFEGKLTSSKWGKITKCSADTGYCVKPMKEGGVPIMN